MTIVTCCTGWRRSHLPSTGLHVAGLLAGVALILAASSAGAIECTDFSAGVLLNWPDLGAETEVDIVYDDRGVLHAVWLSGAEPTAFGDVYYARSSDGGRSFSHGVKVNRSDQTAVRFGPTVEVLNGTVYVAWTDYRAGGADLDIYFSKSISKSNERVPSFTEEVRVNDLNQGDQSIQAIRVTPSGTVYIGWISHLPVEQPSVRITRSVGGLPFEPSRQVNGGPIHTSCECCNIEITSIGEDEVFVAYMSNLRYVRDIFVSRSADGGWTFDDPVQVNEDHWLVPACPITGPRMLLGAKGHLNIVWLDGHEGVSNVYYARSTDGGRTFLHHTRMNEIGDHVDARARVAVTPDGTVHAVWEQFNYATSVINLYYAHSTDGGATFSTRCPISGGSTIAQALSSIAASPDGSLSLAWSEERMGTLDIFVSTVGVTTAVGGEHVPQIAWSVAPNPFRGWVGIEPAGGAGNSASRLAGFTVFDVRGRYVREVWSAGGPLGWDGRDDRGRHAAPGLYFLRLPGVFDLRVTKLR